MVELLEEKSFADTCWVLFFRAQILCRPDTRREDLRGEKCWRGLLREVLVYSLKALIIGNDNKVELVGAGR
jgi:hypothetical protein